MKQGRYLDSKGDTHSMIPFVYDCQFDCLHFEQSHQERKCGFRSLIFVHPVGMESVPAPASRRIVEWNMQIVLAEEPAENPLGLFVPLSLFSEPVYLKAGRDCRTGLDG